VGTYKEGRLKARFKVRVRRIVSYDVDVEADTSGEAEYAAGEAQIPERFRMSIEDLPQDIETRALCQVGEPWVYGWSGESPDNSYRGRPDGYMDTKDLLVFRAPFGRAFSEQDVALLRERAASHVGVVAEHWNGAGTSSLSVRLTAPFGQLSDEQVAAIMGPR
jgi:hypothetical protein